MSAAFLWRWRHLHGCQNPVRALISCWSSHCGKSLGALGDHQQRTHMFVPVFRQHSGHICFSAGKEATASSFARLFILSSLYQILWEARGIICPEVRWPDQLGSGSNPAKWLVASLCSRSTVLPLTARMNHLYLSSTSIDPSRHRWPVSVLFTMKLVKTAWQKWIFMSVKRPFLVLTILTCRGQCNTS